MVTRDELPPGFVERLAPVLGAGLDDFVASQARFRTRGLRWNPAKVSPDERRGLLALDTEPVPWCPDGERLIGSDGLGGHPAHLAGLFYLQEPSAMAVVEALAPEPGWRVADLAAAPGGKTTHLAARVGPDGLVVANEIDRRRLRALHDNLDLWGSANVVTTSLPLDALAALEGEGFDGVVLDAPCSGEALFRRDPAAVRHWSPAAVEGSARRQAQLLTQAAAVVRPGGVLVYSTCSFSPEENEDRVAGFLADQPGWTLEDCARLLDVDPGLARPPYATELTARLWPHRVPGEGQFVARLRREPSAGPRRPLLPDASGGVDPVDGVGPGSGPSSTGSVPGSVSGSAGRRRGSARAAGRRSRDRVDGGRRSGSAHDRGSSGRSARTGADVDPLDGWARFRRRSLWIREPDADALVVTGDRIWARPAVPVPLDGLELVRPGLPLGRQRPGRFVPDPALATALTGDEAAEVRSWAADDRRLAAFGRGETIEDDGRDGWVLVALDRWGLAWGHRTGGRIKNHVPAHVRRQAAAHQRRSDPA